MNSHYFVLISITLSLAACHRETGTDAQAAREHLADSSPIPHEIDVPTGETETSVKHPWPTATIADRDTLGERVDSETLTIAFSIQTDHLDAFTILCRAGNGNILASVEKEECDEEYELTGIKDDVSHTFEVYARRKDSDEERRLETVTFTREKYEIVLLGEERLLNQRSGIIHLGIRLNKPRPVYFICGAETSFYDPSMECRDGRLTVNLNRFAGGVYFTIGAYDAATHKKLVEKNFPFCPGQLCAQGIGLPPPPSL